MTKKIIVLAFLALSSSIVAERASADTPSVVSFSANPMAISYGLSINFSWELQNSGGASLTVSCPAGVILQNTTSGGSFPCNSKTFISQYPSDSIGLSPVNYSGSTKNIAVQLTPRDTSGSDYPAAIRYLSVSVGTSPQPIQTISIPTSTPSGVPTTLSWSSHDIPGVNLIVVCDQSGVTASSTSASVNPIPCGTLAFSSPQSPTGSLSLSFNNQNSASTTATIMVIPAISSDAYDATHGLRTTLVVGPYQPPPQPRVNTFTASPSYLSSGAPVSLSWNTSNVSGVNLLVNCGVGVSVGIITGTTTTQAVCNQNIFPQALQGNSSTTLSFTNTSGFIATAQVLLMPQLSDGSYNAMLGKTVVLSIMPPGTSQPPPTPQAHVTTPANNVTTASSPTSSIGLPKYVFTSSLQRGARGASVTALQQYFAADPTTYPGALVTGYFGILTENLVKIFQKKYGIATSGDAGYGTVGPKTRAKLNTLLQP